MSYARFSYGVASRGVKAIYLTKSIVPRGLPCLEALVVCFIPNVPILRRGKKLLRYLLKQSGNLVSVCHQRMRGVNQIALVQLADADSGNTVLNSYILQLLFQKKKRRKIKDTPPEKFSILRVQSVTS